MLLLNYCLSVQLCLCNKKDLAWSIWLLCQSYFHNGRCQSSQTDFLTHHVFQLFSIFSFWNTTRKVKTRKQHVWTHYPVCLSWVQICFAKQLQLHVGKTCPTVWNVWYWGILTIHPSQSLHFGCSIVLTWCFSLPHGDPVEINSNSLPVHWSHT